MWFLLMRAKSLWKNFSRGSELAIGEIKKLLFQYISGNVGKEKTDDKTYRPPELFEKTNILLIIKETYFSFM